MRRILCLIAAFAGFALSGCVAITISPSDVTQTSAKLRAKGHTDDSPAHFHFRYAHNEADLATSAAKRTPERTVPANVPQDGSDIVFGETVTGLSPGRVYFYEVCGGDAEINPDVCGGRQRFVTPPTQGQDWVQGQFRYGGEYGHIVFVNAASGPQGQSADGWITDEVRYFGKASEGRVTCLAVDDGQAAIGIVGFFYQSSFGRDPRPYSAVLTLRSSDSSFHVVEQSPPDCAGASFEDQQEAFNFGVGFNDAD